MDASQKISIITVNYGSAKKVQKLYESIIKNQPPFTWELIIVDNHSVNHDVKILNTFFDQKENAHVIALSKNIGFGRGNDEGLKFAKGEIIAFVNPDIEVSAKSFDFLLEELNREKIGITVPVLKTFDGKFLENAWPFPNLWFLFKRRLFGLRSTTTVQNIPTSVPWAQGSFFVMKKSLYESLGGFDHRFFLFFEDTDLCRRVWNAGFRVVQVPSAIAFHEEKRLSGHDIFQSLGRKTFWIHVISMMKYFWKYKKKSPPVIF